MTIPFACDMTHIPADQRDAHHALIRRLMTQALEEIREQPNALSLRFPAREYEAVAAFVGRERLCCPFLAFTLDLAPGQGPLTLTLTGPDGVTAFIRAELGLPAG